MSSEEYISVDARECYTDDWQRTGPDLVVYLPKTPRGSDGYADHFLVDWTPGGDLLAISTQSGIEGSDDFQVAFRRSQDHGHAWTRPQQLARAEFGFPVISRNSRTDGPPLRPGGSRDAIIADNLHCYPPFVCEDSHIGFSIGSDTWKLRRENDVASADGHVEIHNQKAYLEGQYVLWDGAGWVDGYGSERLQY